MLARRKIQSDLKSENLIAQREGFYTRPADCYITIALARSGRSCHHHDGIAD
jgi:hypothetical protein